ncbi:hypothetical protein CYMTET_7011 [Cymbomonas tetramitiformis]|uniref:SWIM-type domain-containing protein n=1 Tax=Cymbomonas tetramitiformis TaxID=36881 RepID=A0AAE0GW22_9CHLO|nr:hypothetical protein CYMTET_7011 [Cymbomonas tetramitiformis]
MSTMQEGNLTPYELERERLIARNRERLRALGIPAALLNLQKTAQPSPKIAEKKAASVPHKRKLDAPAAPSRRSRRLNAGPGGEGAEAADEEPLVELPDEPRVYQSYAAGRSWEERMAELALDGLVELTNAHVTIVVIGSRGNHYVVTLANDSQKCQCPDFRIRKRHCKHIRLVLEQLKISDRPNEWHSAVEERFTELIGDGGVDKPLITKPKN